MDDLRRADADQQAKLTALKKKADDCQTQLDDLRRVVNYNANAANSSRY